jgi:hypothetical protein
VSPVSYERGFYIPEDDIFHSHRRDNLRYSCSSSGTNFSVSESSCDGLVENRQRIIRGLLVIVSTTELSAYTNVKMSPVFQILRRESGAQITSVLPQ